MSPPGPEQLVVVRGAGDIATGVIQKLAHAGFRVLAFEVARPSAIRWRAALCPAVQHGRWAVEDLLGVRVESPEEAVRLWDAADRAAAQNRDDGTAADDAPRFVVPVLVDPDATCAAALNPAALVDAVLAKRNLGTHRGLATVTVACGPGFTAGRDVDLVVETMRGHDLGRVLRTGAAQPNTGIPGLIAGRAAERVLHAPVAGRVEVLRGIGDVVVAGELVCVVHPIDGASVAVPASLSGVIRGMIPDGYDARARLKIADIDPRAEMVALCDTISDKSRAVGGGALDAVLLGLRESVGRPLYPVSVASVSGP